jgi:hypothetical protein
MNLLLAQYVIVTNWPAVADVVLTVIVGGIIIVALSK